MKCTMYIVQGVSIKKDMITILEITKTLFEIMFFYFLHKQKTCYYITTSRMRYKFIKELKIKQK